MTKILNMTSGQMSVPLLSLFSSPAPFPHRPVLSFRRAPKGELLISSVRLPQSFGTSVAVDETGDAYVAGFIASSPDNESGDQIVVHKV